MALEAFSSLLFWHDGTFSLAAVGASGLSVNEAIFYFFFPGILCLCNADLLCTSAVMWRSEQNDREPFMSTALLMKHDVLTAAVTHLSSHQTKTLDHLKQL